MVFRTLCASVIVALIVTLNAIKVDGQEKVKTEDDITEADIKRAFNKHRRLLSECFKKYMELSSFQNDKGYFEESKIEEFKDLFMRNARVYNDVAWEPSVIDHNRYADEVWLYMKPYGIRVEYEEDVLDEFLSPYAEMFDPVFDLTDPTLNTVKYKFRTTKKLYHILNKKKQVLRYDEPIEYELEFTFYVSTADGQWAKIIRILPTKN